jgi:hypothetical protein
MKEKVCVEICVCVSPSDCVITNLIIEARIAKDVVIVYTAAAYGFISCLYKDEMMVTEG